MESSKLKGNYDLMEAYYSFAHVCYKTVLIPDQLKAKNFIKPGALLFVKWQ